MNWLQAARRVRGAGLLFAAAAAMLTAGCANTRMMMNPLAVPGVNPDSTVSGEWGDKRQTERQAAAIPFTLANTEAWAERSRAKIPASERSQPAPSVAEQSEAYAAAQRARATPPPPPQ